MLKRKKLLGYELCRRFLTRATANEAVGLPSDRIGCVLHLSEDVIDTTPAVISSYGKMNNAIPTASSGRWLILFVDETLIRYSGEMAATSICREAPSKTGTEMPESDFSFCNADSICIKQGACGNSMAHGNLSFYIKNRQDCRYKATCLSSPSLPLHFNISMGAPKGVALLPLT